MSPTFLRRTTHRYSKLGKGNKRKQTWRNPTGRHNKMRNKRRGYPATVSIGYKQPENARHRAETKQIIEVRTLRDLERVSKNHLARIMAVGTKRKLALAQKAKEKGITLLNLNVKTFLKRNTKKTTEKKT